MTKRFHEHQSPNWETFQDVTWFVAEGYPFQEGFPSDPDARCEIIRRDGEHLFAYLDTSTQYRAEGLTWITEGGQEVHKPVVVAWRVCPKALKSYDDGRRPTADQLSESDAPPQPEPSS